MEYIFCENCKTKYPIIDILDNANGSSPGESILFFECKKCKKQIILYLEKNRVSVINYLAESNWEILKAYVFQTFDIRVDPEYLHCWYNNKHYEVKKRN